MQANERETDRKVRVLPKVDSSGYPVLRAEVGVEYQSCQQSIQSIRTILFALIEVPNPRKRIELINKI